MNFFKYHIGDYAKKTSHLTWDEDMAYTRLMRAYYATEKPLPADLAAVIRLARARTKAQKTAVEQVLREFFELTDAGWSNGRCEEEIEAAKESFDETVSLKKNEKERQQRHRKERKELFSRLRAAGVVMPFDTNTETLRLRLQSLNGHGDVTVDKSRSSRVRHASLSHHVTRDATAIQTPDTRLQEDSERETLSAAGQQGESDPRKTLWRLAVTLLGDDSRSVVGAAIKRVGESKVGEILGSMAVKPPADPKPYFIKATQERGVVV